MHIHIYYKKTEIGLAAGAGGWRMFVCCCCWLLAQQMVIAHCEYMALDENTSVWRETMLSYVESLQNRAPQSMRTYFEAMIKNTSM